MNKGIYGKLVVTNLKNNRKTYVPYILTAVLTVMMYYMMDSLARSEDLINQNVKTCLIIAVSVIAIFAVIFLFYTNSFLIKRRKKEIGVYNILGMGKRHVARMLALETFIISVVSIVTGILGGIIFSKLMYLALLKLLHYDVQMNFAVSSISVGYTVILFVSIFSLTLIYNLFQIKIANPIELLRGGNVGEREPRTKWILTVFGIITIGIGYYIALTTESPLSALSAFFVAVVCVVLGTYALFTAGSIAILKALRKNKNYYYKTKHFTAVSGMIYRMKQNAVGLANICILSTMVLVMVSTSVSLYVGMDDVLKTRFPRECKVVTYVATDENVNAVDRIIAEETEKEDVKLVDKMAHKEASLALIGKNGKFSLADMGSYAAANLSELTIITQDEYNKLTDKNVSLEGNDVLLFKDTKEMYGKDEITIGTRTFRVREELEKFPLIEKNDAQIVPGFYLVVNDEASIQQFFEEAYGDSEADIDWKQQNANIHYIVSFDMEGDEDARIRVAEQIQARAAKEAEAVLFDSREMNRKDFFEIYGSLLFIGIYLGAMFLMATVLIIYYKQISEGLDDKERYQIMQKVGMGKKEVRCSIRSQVLSVFFLPLIVAIIHIAVAFKVVTKLLAILNLVNVPLFFVCTIITIVIFAVFYAIVYGVTAREYYKIVN